MALELMRYLQMRTSVGERAWANEWLFRGREESRNDGSRLRGKGSSGRRATADYEEEEDTAASPSVAGSVCIRSYQWPWRSARMVNPLGWRASRRGNRSDEGLVRSSWAQGRTMPAAVR